MASPIDITLLSISGSWRRSGSISRLIGCGSRPTVALLSIFCIFNGFPVGFHSTGGLSLSASNVSSSHRSVAWFTFSGAKLRPFVNLVRAINSLFHSPSPIMTASRTIFDSSSIWKQSPALTLEVVSSPSVRTITRKSVSSSSSSSPVRYLLRSIFTAIEIASHIAVSPLVFAPSIFARKVSRRRVSGHDSTALSANSMTPSS
mmetsp:Transcript_3979/g.4627  ORF Transcript_3979/g.4627 Transcript_3979/m.4627 type:complete len:203 (+) Transcript_3979:98-706(+)